MNEKTNYGLPALVIAAKNGHKETVKLLLDKGADTTGLSEKQRMLLKL